MSQQKKTPRNILLIGVFLLVSIMAIVFVFALSRGKMDQRRLDKEEAKKVEEYQRAASGSPKVIEDEAERQRKEIARLEEERRSREELERIMQGGPAAPQPSPSSSQQSMPIRNLEPPAQGGGPAHPSRPNDTTSLAAKQMVLPEIYEKYDSEKSADGGVDTGERKDSVAKEDASSKKKSLPESPAVRPLKSPREFWLREGTLMDTVLVTGINTQNPSAVQMRIVTDIYDSLGKRQLLIPRGSVAMGSIAKTGQAGLDRVPLGISRIILPDGRSMQLTKTQGADEMGFQGVPAEFHSNILASIGPSAILAWIGYYVDKWQADQMPQKTAQGSESEPPNISQQIIPKIEDRVAERFGSARPYYTAKAGDRIIIMLGEDVVVTPLD